MNYLDKAARESLRKDDKLQLLLTEQGMSTAQVVYPRGFLAGAKHVLDEIKNDPDSIRNHMNGIGYRELFNARKSIEAKDAKISRIEAARRQERENYVTILGIKEKEIKDFEKRFKDEVRGQVMRAIEESNE